MIRLTFLVLFTLLFGSHGESSPSLSSSVCKGDFDTEAVLLDVNSALSRGSSLDDCDIRVPFKKTNDVFEAMRDVTDNYEIGRKAWNFLSGLSGSEAFVSKFWHKRPLLIRSAYGGHWARGLFTVENDLRLVDGSYITGFQTAEILRNGTKTDTWALAPLKEDPTRKTTWKDVEAALNGGTIYFNTAGGLWKNLGGLCRLTSLSFGLPPNVNVYVTPPGCTISVPPHTDKQDVFVFQTQGAKRWRVYSPPKRATGKDPLARGKAGDILSFEEMGEPLIDTILQPGDTLYVPTGFPHTTDTNSLVDGVDKSIYSEPSVHLTMGLDTHVWFLALAHLRWSLLQKHNRPFNINIEDDQTYWKAMESIPVGFLGGKEWGETVAQINNGEKIHASFHSLVKHQIQDVLVSLEPSRWKNGGGTEDMPTDEEINEVVEFFVSEHWMQLMATQEALFKDVDPTKEESLLKAFRGTQDQNLIMEKLGDFSNNKAFADSFKQRRLANERRAAGAL